MKVKKIMATLLVALLATSVLAGCKKTEPAKPADTKTETQQPAYSGPKVLDYYVGSEPQTLNAQMMTGQPDMFVANMVIEGLARFGKEEGKYEPGVAKKWTYDAAANKYTFELNKDAKWADGTPVTAKDFFLGWRLALEENAPYGFMLTDNIAGLADYAALTKEKFFASKDAAFKALVDARNAEKDAAKKKEAASKVAEALKNMPANLATEYDTQKKALWDKSGVKEVNGNIEVTLAVPCPYFVGLAAFPVMYPVNEKFYNEHKGKDFAIEASGLLSNGPWILKEWKHNDSFKLERNPNYWNKANIKIDNLNIKIVNDINTRTNLLKTGELDGSAIQAADLKTFTDKATRDQYKLGDMVDMPDYTSFYLEFNHFNNPITQNKNIRKAMALALDRKGYVDKIALGNESALAFIPGYFPGLSKSFREENSKTLFNDNDVAKAKEYLAAGLKELGMTTLPKQDMIIDTSDIAKTTGEKVQADLKAIGIEVNLVPVPWGEKMTRLTNGQFGIASSGWGPDYMDPMTFLDLFESTNGNNHGKYVNPKYDELIKKARNEKDAKIRMGYLYEAEKLVIEDMIVAPHYNRIAHWTYKNYLTGVVNRGGGPSTDFYWADINMATKVAQKGK
jgi:oligopeptide transport system substrate-binding protein